MGFKILDMAENKERDSYIFYRSFFEAIDELPESNQLPMYRAIAQFSLNFKEIDLQGIEATMFKLIKPQLEANNKRFINGTKAKRKQNVSKTEANNNVNVNKNVNSNEEKEYTYNAFYDAEILKANNYNYTNLVKYLFGENMLSGKLVGVLSIKSQLTFEEYKKISDKCEINKLKLGQILTKIENDVKYYKGKKSLYRTLLNWAEGRFVK